MTVSERAELARAIERLQDVKARGESLQILSSVIEDLTDLYNQGYGVLRGTYELPRPIPPTRLPSD